MKTIFQINCINVNTNNIKLSTVNIFSMNIYSKLIEDQRAPAVQRIPRVILHARE